MARRKITVDAVMAKRNATKACAVTIALGDGQVIKNCGHKVWAK